MKRRGGDAFLHLKFVAVVAGEEGGTNTNEFANGKGRRVAQADQVHQTAPLHIRDKRAPRVSVVVPTLNEAANLPHVFARLPSLIDEVVVVDGHSEDSTIAVAKQLRPDARIILQSGRGKGNALACGFAAATGDIIVMLDADASTDPAEIPRFIGPLLEGADFVKGSRFLPGGGSDDITRVRAAGNRLLGFGVNVLFRTTYTDLCYGYNAFWRECLPQMQVDCDGFEVETLINVRIARAKLCVIEVPSTEAVRLHGVSNLSAFRDGRRVLMTIVRERMRRTLPPSDSWRPPYRELPRDKPHHLARRRGHERALSPVWP
jgi:glycosyltransferase involved in cell wall biosynthesis